MDEHSNFYLTDKISLNIHILLIDFSTTKIMCDSYKYYGFHESYYEHRCPIIPEQDVLNTDIIGTGCATRIRRWWNDLFLLSSMDERSKAFYKSSHAMRIERFRQYRKYKSRIHPMSKFTNYWNTLILVAFVIDKILFRFNSTILFEDIPTYFYCLGAFLEMIIVLDLIVVMKTGYIDMAMKKIVLDTKKSLIYYSSNKLFIYTISAIPMHWFMFLRFGKDVDCGVCKSNLYVCFIKIISAFSLYRIFEMSKYWILQHSSPRRKLVRIGMVGLMTMLQFYDLVDVMWILLYFRTDQVDERSFLGKLMLMKFDKSYETPNYMILCFDISRIFQSLLLFSFGVKHHSHTLDKMAAIMAYSIANCFYVWGLLECFMIISQKLYPKDKNMSVRCSIKQLLKTRQISDKLKFKVEQYLAFKPTSLAILENGNDHYKCLPDVLKKEIKLCCFLKRLLRLPLFNEWPLPMLEEITLMLKQEVYLGNDVVSDAWFPSRGLIIVDIGILAVYSRCHMETGHLIDGDYFDEISLVTDKEAKTSYLLAATPCRMLVLEKHVFRKYMRQHAQLFYELKEKLLKTQEKSSLEALDVEQSVDLRT